MSSSSSPNPYGKVNEDDHREMLTHRRRTRKRIAIIALSSVILAAVIVGAVVGITQNKNGGGGSAAGKAGQTISSAVKAACSVTLYPDSCFNSISPLALNSGNVKPQDIFKLSVQVALNELSKASHAFFGNIQDFQKVNGSTDSRNNNTLALAAMESCQELLSLAIDHLNTSLTAPDTTAFEAFDDLRTWLSSAGTYQETCIDGLKEAESELTGQIASQKLQNSTEFVSNSLAIVTSLESSFSSISNLGSIGRRRRLLQAKTSSSPVKADAVVARDGSGKYKTIGAALKAVPKKSDKKFVIYVKKGIYNENVRIEKYMWNVLMIGDGKNATIVSGSLNVVDGTPTFQSATFAVFGKGFMAQDMRFQNTAGPSKHQAVALMSTADLSVFYRCSFYAYQDTLYAHSNRQFYRECDIIGTVDFIFGNSAVVFQNCNIRPRKPMPGQQNTITAQGKIDPNQNTGISIQNCTVSPLENLGSVRTYLGRPWKNYSTTAFVQTTMANLIDPMGWLPWVGTTAPDTIYYVEYQNYGPGAVTKNRVKWKGLKLNLTNKMVDKFTVKSFLSGNQWLPSYGVGFKLGL